MSVDNPDELREITSPGQCAEYGKGDDSFRSLMRACRTCKIKHECYEKRQEALQVFRWDHMISVVCDREDEDDVNKVMNKIDKYIQNQFAKIENCDVYFGVNDESGYFEER